MHDDSSPHYAAPQTKNDDNIVAFRKKIPPPKKPPEYPPLLNLPEGTKILTVAIIAVHILMYAASYIFPDFPINRIYTELGFVAARWTGAAPFGLSALLSLITVNFLHGGWLHMGINAGMLVAFGAGFEKRMGVKNMFVLFFLSTIVALFTHLAFSPSSLEPVIGASGGISGLFGAMLVVMKHDGRQIGMEQRLLPMALMWIATSVVFGVMGSPDGSSIAWIAHIGGFIGGMAIGWVMLRK